MADPLLFTCPMCNFADADASFLELHVSDQHPEGPPVPRGGQTLALQPYDMDDGNVSVVSGIPSEEDFYVDCPHSDCGEKPLQAELQSHMDMHLAENMTLADMDATSEPTLKNDREHKRSKTSHHSYQAAKKVSSSGSSYRGWSRSDFVPSSVLKRDNQSLVSDSKGGIRQAVKSIFGTSNNFPTAPSTAAALTAKPKRLGVSPFSRPLRRMLTVSRKQT